ncbi:hypothetical protein BJY00DRAFT_34402 [Aspergillus carlsbadensis]|nr:hypothetical protein BJY00DRAFT_34402 [Aspergillus carlsbadensis]
MGRIVLYITDRDIDTNSSMISSSYNLLVPPTVISSPLIIITMIWSPFWVGGAPVGNWRVLGASAFPATCSQRSLQPHFAPPLGSLCHIHLCCHHPSSSTLLPRIHTPISSIAPSFFSSIEIPQPSRPLGWFHPPPPRFMRH